MIQKGKKGGREKRQKKTEENSTILPGICQYSMQPGYLSYCTGRET
jgi:hypothetical protein